MKNYIRKAAHKHLKGLISERNCSIQKVRLINILKYNSEKAIWVEELWFLCTASLYNVFFHYVKFQADSFHSSWVMIQTKIKVKINKGQ